MSHPFCKELVNYRKLWGTCKDITGTTFILLCDGIFGTIGALVVDETFGYESVTLPIDKLIVGLTRIELDDSKFGPEKMCNDYKYSYSYIRYVVLYSNFLRNRLY